MNLPLKELEALLHKDMSRKEFLRVMGTGALGVVGITGFLQNLNKMAGVQTSTGAQTKQMSSGYGSSPYGK
jgi:hypothetical protein